MKRLMEALFLSALAVATSCTPKAPRIQLTAEPVKVDLGDGSHTTLRITSAISDMDLPDGTTSAFKLTTDYGSFIPTDDDVSHDRREVTQVEVAGHIGSLVLYGDQLPPENTVAHVKATYVDPYGRSATAAVDVEFRPAGDVNSLSFSCSTYNIGALVAEDTDLQIPCSASVATAADTEVIGAKLNFLSEAGKVGFVDDRLYYFPKDPTAMRVAPRDVSPEDLGVDSAEPYRTSPDGKVHNPRDGLVTLVAWVLAPKQVVDRYGLGEPYVDWNDNGTRDADEPFVNLNGDKDQNGADIWNEVQDDDPAKPHALWKQIKVLWTGALTSELGIARVEPTGGVELPHLQDQLFVFTLLDENYNVLASNDRVNDTITWIAGPAPDATIVGGETVALSSVNDGRRLGMLLDDNFNLMDPSSVHSWELGASYGVVVRNTMQCNTPLTSELFTVEGRVAQSLTLSEFGTPASRSTTSTLSVGGELLPPAPTTCAP